MKKRRNVLYVTCGIIMLISIALIAAYSFSDKLSDCDCFQDLDPIFWLETFALWAFGLSWLTKGRTILTDREN